MIQLQWQMTILKKPAKLIVKNGEMRVQVPMNHSAWITEFKAPENGNFVDAKVVSKDESADKKNSRV